MEHDDRQTAREAARITAFAEALRALKDRTPHSYETLATRLGISRSTLHRYCSGKAVPADFQVVRQLARQAGAEQAELAELHRLWALAGEARAIGETQPAAAAGAAAKPPAGERDAAAEGTREAEPAEAAAAAGGPGEPAGAEREQATTPAAVPAAAAEPGAAAEPTVVAGPSTAAADDPAARGRRQIPRGWVLAAAAGAVVVAFLAGMLLWQAADADRAEAGDDDRVLLSSECREPIREGQHDLCVQELQELLAETGVTIGVDGIFGPETLRRLEAFQLRAGLTVDGIAGDETKKALYEQEVDLTTWDRDRVRKEIRKVFTEVPGDAVKIADCQSLLDPLHILPNTNGTRNWGVFQISDARLRDLRGTPEQALDPAWNIRAAHKLWAQEKDFTHWPHCLAALRDDVEHGDDEE